MMLVSGRISRRTALGGALVRQASGKRATTFDGDPLGRRELALLLGGAMMTARILRAQRKAMPVIGLVSSTSPSPNAANVAAFRQGLSEIGYVEGQNLAIEYRWAERHHDRLPALAADLVGHNVDVIIAMGGTPSALAAINSTSTIPIIFLVLPGRVRPRHQSRAVRRQRDRRRYIHA
jgi:ABC transporter substrate binding protein